MPAVCKNCGCSEIDSDATRGDAVCTNCGSVIDNQIIVAEVEFEENSAGGANVVGQFISAEGGRNFTFGGTFKNGYGHDSRQATLANGKFLINNCGNQLKFSPHCLDTAFMFYKLAVSKRMTQGRRLPHVIGSCLYLVSRTEKTPHLLIDISDACQVDMKLLGKTYLLLAKELCIEIPLIDPCLYIHRFAHQLGFKEKENEIAMTAVRIVARMKRDWLQYGRRPSGLCGAALVIAARLHGLKIHNAKVVKVVRVAQTTLVKRLHDFARTPTSRLTIDEFHKVDLEEEMDPPCFTASRNRLKHAQIFEEKMNLDSAELLAQVAMTQSAVEKLISKRKQIEEQLIDGEQSTAADRSAARKQKMKDVTASCSTEPAEMNAADLVKHLTHATDVLKSYASLGNDDQASETDNKIQEELDIVGLDDNELDELLLDDDEVEMKTKLWMEENEEFLAKQKEKEEQAAKELEENKDKPKKKKYTKRKREHIEAATADEAIKTLLAEKRLSTKINYEVLRGLKNEKMEDEEISPKLETVIESGPVRKPPKIKLKSALKTSSLLGGKTEAVSTKKGITFSFADEKPTEKTTIKSIVMETPAVDLDQSKAADNVVVESGPVAVDVDVVDDEVVDVQDDAEDDNEGHVSASAIFGQQEEVEGYNEYDMYDDDDSSFY